MKLLKYLLLFPIFFNAAIAQTPNTWVQKASLPDTARAGAFAFSIGNKGYLGGGFNNGWQTFLKDFWEYDPTTDTWTKKNDFPFGKRALGISFSCNGKGYVGLGQDTLFYDSLHTDLWEYNPISDSWVQKAFFPSDGRIYSTSFVIDSVVYIGIGMNSIGNPLQDFWAYNTTTNTWIQKANFIGTSRIEATSFASSAKGYVGLGDDFFQRKNDWYKYNPISDNWVQKNNFPGAARNYALGLNINGKLFVGGGGISTPNGILETSDFWEYFPNHDAWNQKCNIPDSFTHFCDFSINNKGYFLTGFNGLKNKYLKTNYEYTADTLDYNGIDNPELIGISCFTFPNPASEKITFQFMVHSKSENPNDKIEVYNSIGQSILTFPVNVMEGRNTISVSLAALSSGIYFYKITNNIKGSFLIEK